MDLRSVRYFVSVAEHLHFGRAAEQMNVVQSAISQQIKRLEEELDTKLFERSWNELRLTEAGRQMLPSAAASLFKPTKPSRSRNRLAQQFEERLILPSSTTRSQR